jgi:cysteine synthase A
MGWTDYLPSAFISTAWLDKLRPAVLSRRLSKDLFIGLLVGITLSLSSTSAALYLQQYRRKKAIQRIPPGPIELRSEEIGDGVIGLIGVSDIGQN